MARVNIDGPDRDQLLKAYALPYVGSQTITGTTCAVSMTTIAATDLVFASAATFSTAAYIISLVVTAGTGFVATVNTSPGTGTINYVVFKPNA